MLKQSNVVLIVFIAAGLIAASSLLTSVIASGSNFKKYGNINKLTNAIDNGNFDDDNINFGSLKSWSGYQNADDEIQDCIKDKNNLGNNLADYEILKCVDRYD